MKLWILLVSQIFFTFEISSNSINDNSHSRVTTIDAWPEKLTVTWKLDRKIPSNDWEIVHRHFELVFKRWNNQSNIILREVVAQEDADLVLNIVYGSHEDGLQFNVSGISYTGYIQLNSERKIQKKGEDNGNIDLQLILIEFIGFMVDPKRLDNQAVSMNDQDISMVKEETMLDIQRGKRITRTIKNKQKKNKKSKNTKVKCKKTKKRKKCRSKKTTKRVTQKPTVTKKKTITFPKKDLAKIEYFLINTKSSNQLLNFSRISDMIKDVTGLLTENNTKILQKLAATYADTTIAIKVSIADSCATLSRFVIKCYRIMQRSMNENDLKVLKAFNESLHRDTLNQFKNFKNYSYKQLYEIHKELLENAFGKHMVDLGKDLQEAEKNLFIQANDLQIKRQEVNRLQADLEAAKYENNFVEKANKDSRRAKEEAEAEINQLSTTMKEYEEKLLKHRNTKTELRIGWGILSWKVLELARDNGENIIRESINRLQNQSRCLKDIVANWPNKNSMNRGTVLKHNITHLSNDIDSKQILLKNYEATYNQTEQRVHSIIKRMRAVEKKAGSTSLESIKAIDRLALAVHNGYESFASAYAEVVERIKALDADPDMMVNSVRSAIIFLKMADDYMKGSRVDDIRLSLGISKPDLTAEIPFS